MNTFIFADFRIISYIYLVGSSGIHKSHLMRSISPHLLQLHDECLISGLQPEKYIDFCDLQKGKDETSSFN